MQQALKKFKDIGISEKRISGPFYLWGEDEIEPEKFILRLGMDKENYRGQFILREAGLFFESPENNQTSAQAPAVSEDQLVDMLRDATLVCPHGVAYSYFNFLFEKQLFDLLECTDIPHEPYLWNRVIWLVRDQNFFIAWLDNCLQEGRRELGLWSVLAYLKILRRNFDSENAFVEHLGDHTTLSNLSGIARILLFYTRLDYGWPCYQAAVRRNISRLEHDQTAGMVTHPYWESQELKGKKVLLRRITMGPGDEVLYSRIFQDLLAHGVQLVVEVDWRLVSLFKRSFPEAEVYPRQNPPLEEVRCPSIDYQMTFSDSFRIFRKHIDDFPEQEAYLVPDSDVKASWAVKLKERANGKMLVGLCWESQSDSSDKPEALVQALEEWLPILELPNIQFVSLGYHSSAASECREISKRANVDIYHPEDLDLYYDFEGMAGFISNLDSVVSIHGCNYSLASALGIPCWLTTWSSLQYLIGQDFDPYFRKSKVFLWDESCESSDAGVSRLVAAFKAAYEVKTSEALKKTK